MMDAPKIIWLQRPNRDPENEWCGEVTWCEDRQNDDDTCYVRASAARADAINQLRAELEAVKKERDELAATNLRNVVEWRNELAACQQELKEARANDMCAMGYLSQVRAIVGGKDFPDMCKRVDACQKECSSLRSDAERYRWLRIQTRPEDYYAGVGFWEVSYQADGMGNIFRAERLDTAIDAAMQKEQTT